MPILFDEMGSQLNSAGLVSLTSPALVTAGTIATAGLGVSRVTPAAAVTAIVLQRGTINGQRVTVTNEGLAASTITFDVAANSNVADGVTSVIPGLRSSTFTWVQSTLLWTRTA